MRICRRQEWSTTTPLIVSEEERLWEIMGTVVFYLASLGFFIVLSFRKIKSRCAGRLGDKFD